MMDKISPFPQSNILRYTQINILILYILIIALTPYFVDSSVLKVM